MDECSTSGPELPFLVPRSSTTIPTITTVRQAPCASVEQPPHSSLLQLARRGVTTLRRPPLRMRVSHRFEGEGICAVSRSTRTFLRKCRRRFGVHHNPTTARTPLSSRTDTLANHRDLGDSNRTGIATHEPMACARGTTGCAIAVSLPSRSPITRSVVVQHRHPSTR
jgi:hypothetical protein